MQDDFDSDDNDVVKNGRFRRRIDTPVRIRRELTRLYYDWRTGDTPSEAAARMAGLLKILHAVIVGDATERRLRDLEAFRDERLAR